MAQRKATTKFIVVSNESVEGEYHSLEEAVKDAKANFGAGYPDTYVAQIVKKPRVTWED